MLVDSFEIDFCTESFKIYITTRTAGGRTVSH